MISLILIGVCLLIAVSWLLATRANMFIKTGEGYNKSVNLNTKWFLRPVLLIVIGLLIGLFQPYVLDRVDQGNVGIKVNLTGDSRGVSDYTYQTGWVVYNTWTENLYMFPTFQQHIEYPDQIVITKGGFQANIKPTFNYSIKSTAVGDMFSQLRLGIKEIEQGWLLTAIVGSVNDVANKWEVDAIFNNREQFESAIVAECNKRVIKWFTISQLRTNIIPPDALKEAIVNKTKAIQEAQAKMQEALVAEANAKKMIAEAKGDSAKAVITSSGKAQAAILEARGMAEAMRLKQQQLTPLYVEYIKANQWSGNLPNTMLSGATPFINLK